MSGFCISGGPRVEAPVRMAMEFLCYQPADPDEVIAFGPLLSDDGTSWLGRAALVRAPDPGSARAILTADRYGHVEVRRWRFGGRR